MSVKGTRNLFCRGYPRTRRYTRISRELLTAWIKRTGPLEKTIPSENVPALLSDMRLHTSKAQVGEMLECAKDVADRRSHLPYGDFYNYASQIKRSHDRGNLRQLGRNGDQKKRRPRKMSKHVVPHDVFLGGSCNPTTWRHDVAIPLLKSLGISYYNPQVSEWSAELVEVEHNAKESARVLFYVLDRSTRNVVGIVEAANFAGSRRHLVLVADTYDAAQPVGGEKISYTEYEELCSGLLTLKDLVERQGIPVFSKIPDAINWTKEVLIENCNQLSTYKALRKVLLVEDPIRTRKLREIFDALDQNGRGEITLSDFLKRQSLIDLKNRVSSAKASNTEGIKINFDQFCEMSLDLENGVKTRNGALEKQTICCKNSRANHNSRRTNSDIIERMQNDIYIGGSCFDFEWKQNIALPLLKESGLRFVMAECSILNSSRAAPNEANVMDNSRVLMFILTNNTRGLETMALAAYYIGAAKNVILCVQELKETNLINGEKISSSALNDYNRGRVYLSDLARRNGIPIFDNISETVQHAIAKCSSPSSSS